MYAENEVTISVKGTALKYLFCERGLALFRAHKWGVHSNGYLVRHIPARLSPAGKQLTCYFHRELMGLDGALVVDHINGNTRDNRAVNLRVCTAAENRQNFSKTKRNSSGFLGVSWCRERGKWYAYVVHGGRTISAGCHITVIEAAHARDALAKKLRGRFAKLNFPGSLHAEGAA